ncbi:MAG: helix-turn-helix domain-containing protein [bacterium]|nr:helix-turn-helix domain-containing protein [bacterium]
MRRAIQITLSEAERAMLERLKRGRRVTVRLAERAAIVLHAADGLENQQIAALMGISRQKVGRWRDRYAASGLAGIEKDAPRPSVGRGRRPTARSACTEIKSDRRAGTVTGFLTISPSIR